VLQVVLARLRDAAVGLLRGDEPDDRPRDDHGDRREREDHHEQLPAELEVAHEPGEVAVHGEGLAATGREGAGAVVGERGPSSSRGRTSFRWCLRSRSRRIFGCRGGNVKVDRAIGAIRLDTMRAAADIPE
jgi:hypothetical protein